MQLSIRAPYDISTLTDMASTGRAIQRALALALDAGTPEGVPDAAARAVSVYLPATLAAQLSARDADVAALAGRLLAGWALEARKAKRASDAPPPVHVTIDGLRPEQAVLINAALPLLEAGGIVFAEASTGIGKSRAMAVLAQEMLARKHTVTIAVPTIEVMLHVAREFDALGYAPPTIYLGRRQFVSPLLLADLLADMDIELPDDERARLVAWDGLPVTERTREIARRAGGASWLLADLEVIAPSVAPDLVACEDEDATPDAYAAMLDAWNSAPIRLATHALLAVIAKHAKPSDDAGDASNDVLLVDEAHALHSTIEDVCLGQFSFFRLRALLRTLLPSDGSVLAKAGVPTRKRAAIRRAAHTAVVAIDGLLDATARLPSRRDVRRIHQPDARPENCHLADHLSAAATMLAPAIAELRGINVPGLDRAVAQCQDVCRMIQRKSVLEVSLSPTRQHPSIRMNYGSVTATMERLWAGTHAAALLSATLLTETATGASAGYFVNRLRVPIVRARELPPITARWLHTTPTLFLPALADRAALVPVTRPDDSAESFAAERRYYAALARAVAHAAKDAAGGMLVLCSGYRAIELLAERLPEALAPRLLVQRRGTTFARWPLAFRGMGAEGRPIWLACGPAWTGLDLRCTYTEPSKDRLLTDVVVTRIPYLLADAAGSAKMRDYQARTEAALRFRQGMGRLVRAEGQPDRRLWVLDGRLWSTRPWDRMLAAPCLKALAQYPKRREFSPSPLDTADFDRAFDVNENISESLDMKKAHRAAAAQKKNPATNR